VPPPHPCGTGRRTCSVHATAAIASSWTLLASCWPANPGYANLFSSAPVVSETAAPCADKQRRGQEPGDVTSSAPSRHARPAALDQRSPVRAVPQCSGYLVAYRKATSLPWLAGRAPPAAASLRRHGEPRRSAGDHREVKRPGGGSAARGSAPGLPVHPTSFCRSPALGDLRRERRRGRGLRRSGRADRCWVAGRGPRRGRWSWTPAGTHRTGLHGRPGRRRGARDARTSHARAGLVDHMSMMIFT